MTISAISSPTATQATTTNDGFNQLFSDFKSFGSAIQSGDLSSAQSALTTFTQDLQNNTGKNPLSRLFSQNSTLSKDLQSLQTALQSNDAAGAQNAFKTLVQDMQGAMRSHRHHHHHHHVRRKDEGGSDDGAQSTTPVASTSGTPSDGGTLNVQA